MTYGDRFEPRPASGPGGAPASGPPGTGERRGSPDRSRGRRPGGRFPSRRKVCQFCMDNISEADYKDIPRLRRCLSERSKIEPRRKTGTCARHQRSMTVAVKRARHLALLPFVGGSSRY